MRPPVIIPAYQPGPELEALVKALISDGHTEVIIMDDGSSQNLDGIFSALRGLPGVHLLRHAVNLGKGQALKTAFNYFLTNFPKECPGVITADADGQHLPKDIAALSHCLSENPSSLCLGKRRFKGAVPARSLFGNTLTRLIFRGFSGRSLGDTQTGLRGIPRTFLSELLGVRAQGYEFELEMLLLAVRSGMRIREIPIETVYLRGNDSSHFNPLLDSLRIYFVFLRFSASSLLTAVVDNAVFVLVHLISSKVFLSIVIARLLAGSLNFMLGKKIVFKSKERVMPEIAKYATLVSVFMLISYGMVTAMVAFAGINVYAAKLLTEGSLFLASFAAQSLLVFSRPDTDLALRDSAPGAGGT